MLKKFMTTVFLLVMFSSVLYGAEVKDYPNDDSHYLYYNLDDTDSIRWASYLYRLYGNDAGFNYQLRGVAGNGAGSQWFATVYENYYRHHYYTAYNTDSTVSADIYRRTMGGEIPEIPISAVANLVGGFNFVVAEEPQPYDPSWSNIYDEYPDPIESICIVIKNGQGDFNVDFGNPYASHTPYWWDWATTGTLTPYWWREANHQSINQPIAYIADTSANKIYEHKTDGTYAEIYTISADASGDAYKDLSGNTVYKLSGDIVCNASGDAAYLISNDEIYTMTDGEADEWKYKLEYEDDVIYVCELRAVDEYITIEGFEDDYTFSINPSAAKSINPADYLNTAINIRSTYGADFGSTLGYITFHQKADLARGYTRYSEYHAIPLVIANVSNGNAYDNPLEFDMIVFNASSDVDTASRDIISRVKFNWDAQSNMPAQDLGTFFMMQTSLDTMPVYYLETRITNRTGTRYELYRYDMMNSAQTIYPDHWEYDLVHDLYGTLPSRFHLDAHSQIAPGLVTVYNHSVYGTVNTNYDTHESFRLSEPNSTNPKDLRLNYRRIRGMYPAGERVFTQDGLTGVQGFSMQFTDVANNTDETVEEIKTLTGKYPEMVIAGESALSADSVYINSAALNSFRISKDVTEDLLAVINYEVISDDEETETTSPDAAPDNNNENQNENQENENQDENNQNENQENNNENENNEGNEENNENAEGASVSLRAAASDDKVVYSSDKIALQPVAIRLMIPRQNQLIVSAWDRFEAASSNQALFELFRNYGTVWVRSEATRERDMNLFRALDEQDNGTSAAECVNAFLYDDKLYLDFIVVIADAVSINSASQKTAFLKVFKDDGVPYILLGDGTIDKRWDLTFFVAAPDVSTSGNSAGENTETNEDSDMPTEKGSSSTCNFGFSGIIGLMILISAASRPFHSAMKFSKK